LKKKKEYTRILEGEKESALAQFLHPIGLNNF